MKRYVIYIPGLGDTRVGAQRLAVRTWRLWGMRGHLFQMKWADGEAFAPKLERLLAVIDDLASRGTVSLVAASAGATAAMNALAVKREVIKGVVCIAGKINHPEAISQSYTKHNPAFSESALLVPTALAQLSAADRARITSIRAMFDPVVPARDSIVEGARNRVTWTTGHALTIAVQITLGAPFFLRFLKRL